MGRIQITGKDHPVGKIFSNDFVFSIPKYQRPYAWEKEQAEELLDDLLGFLGDDHISIEQLNPYFLGSVVLIKEEYKADSEVVDGQQRLTTLTILLSAIRTLLQAEHAKGLDDFIYEKGNPISRTKDRYRLTLRERDAEFFRDYIQRPSQIEKLRKLDTGPLSDSQKNIRSNAIVLVDRLKKLSEDRRLLLAQFIIEQCLMVVVSTPDFDSAYRIFSILNNRGLDLSHSDILKAELIGKIPVAEQDDYGEKWENAEEELGRDAFSDLFSFIRTVFRKQKLRGTVLNEFKEYVVTKVTDPKELIDNVLIPFADAYSNIKDENYESAAGAEQLNYLFGWLNRIDNTDWLPAAILYLSKNRNRPKAMLKFFTDLERLAAVSMLLRASINERIERFGRLISAIEKGSDLYDASSPLQLTDNEMSEGAIALNGDIYTLLPPLRVYLLLRLDSVLSSGGATYEHNLITVEHVLPQNPDAGSEWDEWFPTQEDRDSRVHRFGNLVLLTRRKNSSARNFDFEKKKTSYFSTGGVSVFAITTQVLKEKKWSAAVVDRRQVELVAIMKGLWRL